MMEAGDPPELTLLPQFPSQAPSAVHRDELTPVAP